MLSFCHFAIEDNCEQRTVGLPLEKSIHYSKPIKCNITSITFQSYPLCKFEIIITVNLHLDIQKQLIMNGRVDSTLSFL